MLYAHTHKQNAFNECATPYVIQSPPSPCPHQDLVGVYKKYQFIIIL